MTLHPRLSIISATEDQTSLHHPSQKNGFRTALASSCCSFRLRPVWVSLVGRACTLVAKVLGKGVWTLPQRVWIHNVGSYFDVVFSKTATKHEKYILHFSTLFIYYIKYYKHIEIVIATSLTYLKDEMKFHTENV